MQMNKNILTNFNNSVLFVDKSICYTADRIYSGANDGARFLCGKMRLPCGLEPVCTVFQYHRSSPKVNAVHNYQLEWRVGYTLSSVILHFILVNKDSQKIFYNILY